MLSFFLSILCFQLNNTEEEEERREKREKGKNLFGLLSKIQLITALLKAPYSCYCMDQVRFETSPICKSNHFFFYL
jgi:hypothetical protein